MKRNVIGIDPGEAGGIAFIDGATERMETYNMPTEVVDIHALLQELGARGECRVFLEDVGHGMPGQSSKATATFARHNGRLEMALYALRMPTVKATPGKWQKHFSNTLGSSKGVDKKDWKNKLKNLAQTMHPELKVTLKTADAILIAEYGKAQI